MLLSLLRNFTFFSRFVTIIMGPMAIDNSWEVYPAMSTLVIYSDITLIFSKRQDEHVIMIIKP